MSSEPTLKDVFAPETGDDRQLDSGALMPKIKTALEKQSSVIQWDAIERLIEPKILEMLDVPFQGILLGAWKKYREVREAAQSGESQPVPLLEHTIESVHKPHLDFVLKGTRLAQLEFPVVLTLVLDGFTIAVAHGAIKSISTGQISGTATLAVESEVVLKKDFDTFHLPGTINLGEGIPVA
jgi:hypothetical protein